ncbi:unnamed protein product, partial [Allacma fusca]
IAAACENMGIGYKNDLPWRLRHGDAKLVRAFSSAG